MVFQVRVNNGFRSKQLYGQGIHPTFHQNEECSRHHMLSSKSVDLHQGYNAPEKWIKTTAREILSSERRSMMPNEDLSNAKPDVQKMLENNNNSDWDLMREYANQLNGDSEEYSDISYRED
jgi:hypothetical protein